MARDEQTINSGGHVVSEQGFEPAKVLKDIVASLAPIELRPGEILMRQGEASDAAYFLESGSVLVYAETPYGPVSLATLEGPRLVGEIGAFADLERTASVKAIGAARVFRIGRARLLELGRNSPELLMSVVRQLGQQIDSVNKAVALYTNALEALERREFDEAILNDLAAPSPRLAEFAGAFRRFADQIHGKRRRQDEMAAAAMIQKSFLPGIGREYDRRRFRNSGQDAARARGWRRLLRLLHAGRRSAGGGHRRCLRQGNAGQPVHGGGGDGFARRRPRGGRRGLGDRASEQPFVPRQRGVNVRHGLLWRAGFTQRRARILQLRP